MIQPAEAVKMLSKKLRNGGYLFVEGHIEHNVSIGYYFRKSYFSLIKNNAKQNSRRSTIPYFFSQQKNQLNFFKLMRYSTLLMEIDKTAWPFPDKFADAKNIKSNIEYMLAKISLATPKIFSPVWKQVLLFGKKGSLEWLRFLDHQ